MQNDFKTHLFHTKHPSWMLFTVLGIAAIAVLFAAGVFHNGRVATKVSRSQSAESVVQESVPVRGVARDTWADIVIGQRDFTEINPNEIVADKVFNAGGVVVDNSGSNPGKAYIWDSNNNRILGIDLADCYSGAGMNRCAGQLVLGQPSLNDYGACNRDSSAQSLSRVPASSNSLCGVSDRAVSLEEQRSKSNMAVDSAGNLYVPDIGNNRVLKYNNPFAPGNDTVADEVWGQNDFAGTLPNKGGDSSASAISFNFEYWGSGGREKHGGVALDSQGNLWVADTGNHRVLRFPNQNGQIAKAADIVLGQQGFTNKGPGSGGSGLWQMYAPTALTFDGSGKLYVADSGNTRVLVFTPPLTSHMAGVVFGSDFAHNQPYSSNCNTAIGGYGGAYNGCDGNPWDVQADPQGQGVWTYETVGWDSRMRLWSFSGTLLNTIAGPGRGGGSLGLDQGGNVLVAAGFWSDVFRYQLQQDGSSLLVQRFFSPPSGHNLVTNRRLRLTPQGGVAVVGNQLAVADGRLLFWNNLSSLTNGKAADGYLRTSATDNVLGFTDFPNPAFAYMSGTADKLWVSNGNKILIYQAPFISGSVPMKTISSVNVLGGGPIDFSTQGVTGIAADQTGNFLWVTQTGSHRVLRIRDPLSASPVVDVILGQLNLESKYCNQNPDEPANTNSYLAPNPTYMHLNTLCYPGALGIDRQRNLYVSDHFHEKAGNKRLLMFSAATFPDAPLVPLFAPNATKEFPKSQQFATWQPAFDSTNRMVVGYNPYVKQTRRVDYFNNPTGSSTTPDGQLNDFDAWPIAATFDPQDNLYIYEANRAQVRIYKQPFVRDDDSDGFSNTVEQYLGTDPFRACPVTTTQNDESLDPWPPDFNDNGVVQIDDIFAVSSRFNAKIGDANYTKRAELASQDGVIGIDDLFAVSGRFNKSCTP